MVGREGGRKGGTRDLPCSRDVQVVYESPCLVDLCRRLICTCPHERMPPPFPSFLFFKLEKST